MDKKELVEKFSLNMGQRMVTAIQSRLAADCCCKDLEQALEEEGNLDCLLRKEAQGTQVLSEQQQ